MNPRTTETRRELDPRLGWIEWTFTTCPLPEPSQLSPYGPGSRAETAPSTAPADAPAAPQTAPRIDRGAHVRAVTRTAPGARLATRRLAERLATHAAALDAPKPARRLRHAIASLRAHLDAEPLATAYEPSLWARVAHYHADRARRDARPFAERWTPRPVDLRAEAASQRAALRA